MLENAATLVVKGKVLVSFHEESKTIDSLMRIVNENAEATREQLEKALAYQNDNCGFFDAIWKQCGNFYFILTIGLVSKITLTLTLTLIAYDNDNAKYNLHSSDWRI